MIKTYKYRLYPTPEQQKTLIKWIGACRFVYNLGLETKMRAWSSSQKNLTCFDLMKQLTELKKTECKWLADCYSQSLESALSNLDAAYTAFFKGAGFPKFKKKSDDRSIVFRQGAVIEPERIWIPKIGWVVMIQHRQPENGEVGTVTVTKNPSGSWYVSIVIKNEIASAQKAKIIPETTVGIDIGLKNFANLSDGQVFENPKYLHHELKRLRVEQRTLRRRYKKGVSSEEQSRGYHKQKIVVAKLYEKISNKRNDFLHKTSATIVKQYDTICLEDLNVSGMLKNGSLAKAVSDASWATFTSMLEYKAEWNGKNISYIGRFEPSSKLCSACGNIFKELKLKTREWVCEKCGVKHDRDQNAAQNIKAFGLRKA